MKKIKNYILVVFLLLAFGIINVNAKSYAKDLFQAGDKITIKNRLEGTSFIAGNEINVNNTIDGIAKTLGYIILISFIFLFKTLFFNAFLTVSTSGNSGINITSTSLHTNFCQYLYQLLKVHLIYRYFPLYL